MLRCGYSTSMATRPVGIGRRRKAHLYVKEWIEAKGLSDEQVANRAGVARETVWKWYTYQSRLNPEKVALLASVLELEPQDFYRPPSRRSIDAITKDLPDDIHGDVVEFAERLKKRAS
jgi:transcriptional regulator with XRE-family HTH domain